MSDLKNLAKVGALLDAQPVPTRGRCLEPREWRSMINSWTEMDKRYAAEEEKLREQLSGDVPRGFD